MAEVETKTYAVVDEDGVIVCLSVEDPASARAGTTFVELTKENLELIKGAEHDKDGKCVWKMVDGRCESISPVWPKALVEDCKRPLVTRMEYLVTRLLMLEKWQADPQLKTLKDRTEELEDINSEIASLKATLQ